ncbi:MAG: UbiA family prenyltransferase, partial [Allorhizobium sp.]
MSTTEPNIDRVIDAPSDNFVYRILPRWLWPHAQLARWDRPIGWQLLMWPCFWSSALAANALAAEGRLGLGLFVFHLFLFFVGSVAMRGAGCTYNDLVDHEIDNMVARTRSRPLPSGRISRRNAKIFMVVQSLVGLAVLLCFNSFSIVLGILSLAVVAIYPFA